MDCTYYIFLKSKPQNDFELKRPVALATSVLAYDPEVDIYSVPFYKKCLHFGSVLIDVVVQAEETLGANSYRFQGENHDGILKSGNGHDGEKYRHSQHSLLKSV